jgi:DNA-binding NtrC family response regulator
MLVLGLETPHFNAMMRGEVERGAAGARSNEEISPLSAAKIRTPRVLVVDDEALLRWSLAEMLSDAGYQVVEARDGREARRAFADSAHPVDAMLLDLKLPDVSGLQLLEEARRRCLSCPIIIMTAYGSADTVETLLSSGALRVVSKPFDLDDILRLLRELCPLPPQ